MRETTIERKANGVEISLFLNLDERGENKISTGIGFFDHMLTVFAFHAGITFNLSCKLNSAVNGDDIVEQIGIAVGQAVSTALGERRKINRYGDCFLPMDETLAHCVIDISGKPYLVFNMNNFLNPKKKAGEFDGELAEKFFRAFVLSSGITLHLSMEYGENTHHMIEALFKGFGRAFRDAATIARRAFL
ncbi:MAG: imidazoleglycerol-phosphate dehydratase [Clostridiales bacterium]|jgi:imidazoleglycerol-phosphate dehydratase|nr:imidazoleglycerol-phosphate dehydratase [Clostridiales bacterium]